MATDVQVYFCDPQSPWQRGSNENTNGLFELRRINCKPVLRRPLEIPDVRVRREKVLVHSRGKPMTFTLGSA